MAETVLKKLPRDFFVFFADEGRIVSTFCLPVVLSEFTASYENKHKGQ